MKYSILLYSTKEKRANNTPDQERWVVAYDKEILKNIAKTYLNDFYAVDILRHDIVEVRYTR